MMSEVKWTNEQLEAMTHQNSDVLVSAAAGSGKTAVIVNRIIQNILNETYDIDELFVSTFTNMSAKDMKDKIEHAINDMLKRQDINLEQKTRLENQLLRLKEAHISTLHSFCLYLIKKYYNLIQLSSDMRTMGEVEGKIRLEETIEQVLEQYFRESNPIFLELVALVSNDKDYSQLIKLIKELYYESVASSNPNKYLNQYIDQYINEENIKKIYNDYYLAIYEELESLYGDLVEIERQFQFLEFDETYKRTKSASNNLTDLINSVKENMHLTRESQKLKKLEGSVIGKKSKFVSSIVGGVEIENFIQLIDRAKDKIDDIKSYEPYTFESAKEELSSMNKINNVLIELVNTVRIEFGENKRKRSEMDFSDYEHYALEILKVNNGEISDLYRSQFKEVMIDEYQDINRVQEAIIQLLKSGDEDNGNLFMVGDVKQSIYKFRQADPSLFIEKSERFQKSGFGRLITLNHNFRSETGVIQTTNKVFENIMDEEVGDVKYDENHELVQGKKGNDVSSEVLLLTHAETEDSPEIDVIIQKIKALHSQGVKYKDMVILTRNTKYNSPFRLRLVEENIPVYVNNRSGYLNTLEIRVMMSILNVIDNPYQDDHLVSMMRLPQFDFSSDDLAQIRIQSDEKYLYQAMQNMDETHPLYSKVQQFIQFRESFKYQAKYLKVAELIDEVFHDLNILEYFGGMMNGETRKANLRVFIDYAIDFEMIEQYSLYEFISFIRYLVEASHDFGEASTVTIDDDVVRIMTIHSSKGLEFDHVFYAGLSSKFNFNDMKGRVLVDSKAGISFDYYNHQSKTYKKSMHSIVMKRRLMQSLMSEEMRLIYVAMTRAAHKLYLPLIYGKELELKYVYSNEMVHVSDRINAKNVRDLIAPILLNSNLNTLEIHEVTLEQLNALDNHYIGIQDLEQLNGKNRDQYLSKLLFKYDDTESHIPYKESVSEIKRKNETVPDGATQTYQRRSHLPVPNFMAETTEAPVFGTEMHKVMMHVFNDYNYIKSLSREKLLAYVEKIIDSNVDDTHITNSMKVKMLENVHQFLDDENIKAVLFNSKQLYTETPFVANQSSLGFSQNEHQLVQGIIDLIVESDVGVTIIDYKTDYLDGNFNVQTLYEKYKTQMEIYQRALENAINQPVNVILYYFDYGAILIESEKFSEN